MLCIPELMQHLHAFFIGKIIVVYIIGCLYGNGGQWSRPVEIHISQHAGRVLLKYHFLISIQWCYLAVHLVLCARLQVAH